MHYWLFKSEPSAFSIDDLVKRKNQTTHWDGVRNYQVRNLLRDEIKPGDLGFFYHSSCQPPGIAGVIKVVKAGYPDFSAWDKESDHFDALSTKEKPRWYMVDVKLVKKFSHFVTLTRLKQVPKLKSMQILKKGNRLSITQVSAIEWQVINDMAK